MKRFICLIAALLLFQGMVFPDFSGDTESLIPEDAEIFIKTREINHLLKTANYIATKLLDDKSRKSFYEERNEFRSKTGIDYMNNESLKKCGIDTDRPISFVSFDKDNNRDVMAFLVPIINEKDFPLKFVEVIKKMRPGNDLDLYPVITDYNGSALYQIQKDIFTSTVPGYFVIASTGDLVKKIVDRKNDRKGSLILNSDYSNYLSKRTKSYDINIFLSREFIKKTVDSISGKGRIASLNTIEEERKYLSSHKVMVNTTGNALDGKTENPFDSSLEAVEYLSGGIGFDGNKLQINGSVKLDGNSDYSKAISGLIKTGLVGKMLNMPEADVSLFLSYNLENIKDLCTMNESWCKEYDEIKEGFKSDTGVDFEKEFLPAYSGAATLMYSGSEDKEKLGNGALFLSMKSESSAKKIWSKVKNHLSAKYSGKDKFGEVKYNNGAEGFWFVDKQGPPIHIVYNPRGIYIGSSQEFITWALESVTFNNTKNPGRLGRFINPDTYLIFYLKNSTILKSLAAGKGMNNNLYSGPLSRLGEIFIYCEKKEDFYSLDFDIEFQ